MPAMSADLPFLRGEKKCVKGKVRVSSGGLGMTGRGTDGIAVGNVSRAWELKTIFVGLTWLCQLLHELCSRELCRLPACCSHVPPW